MNMRVRTTSSSAEAGLRERSLDDRERRARLGGGVAGMERVAGRAGVRRPADEAGVPDRDRPRVAAEASHGPPLVTRRRVTRRAAPVARARVRQARTSGSRPMATMSAASSAVRGAIEATSRYSPGAWSRPPIGPRPSMDGTPIPAVVLASDAPPVAASRSSKPSSPAIDCACPTSRPERSSFSIGQCRACSTTSTVTSGITVLAARVADRGLDLDQRVAGDRAHVDVHRAALGDDVRPRAAGDRRRR